MEGKQRAVLTMRSASALRFSKGCSSLNLDRMMTDIERWVFGVVGLFAGKRVAEVVGCSLWRLLCDGTGVDFEA